MVMDLHLPNDWPVTLRVRDQSLAASGGGPPGPPRRSDTARRHMLTRQRPVVDEASADAAKSGKLLFTIFFLKTLRKSIQAILSVWFFSGKVESNAHMTN